jgi:hypothetical protein
MFWAREMKLLNDLIEIFPKQDFWEKVNFEKVPSLAILRSEYGLAKLKKLYIEFNYVIPEKIEIPLGEKRGKDKIISKKSKTIRQFIDEQN